MNREIIIAVILAAAAAVVLEVIKRAWTGKSREAAEPRKGFKFTVELDKK